MRIKLWKWIGKCEGGGVVVMECTGRGKLAKLTHTQKKASDLFKA